MDISGILADPDFHALHPEERRKVMVQVDPDFATLPTQEQHKVIFALSNGATVQEETPTPRIFSTPSKGTQQDVMGIASPKDRQAAETAQTFVRNDIPAIAKTFGAKIGGGMEQSIGGAMRAYGEENTNRFNVDDNQLAQTRAGRYLNDLTAADDTQRAAIAQRGTELGNEGRAVIQAAQEDQPVQTRAGRILDQTAQSIGSNLPGMAATMVTGNPAVGLSMMGLQSFGQTYDESRAKGLNIADATMNAAIQGGSEVATEMLPFVALSKYLKTGNLSKEVLKHYLSDIPGEHIATAIQNASDAAYNTADMTPQQRIDAAADYLASSKHKEDQIDTFFTTVLQGAVMGGVAKVARVGNALAPEAQPAPQPAPSGPLSRAVGMADTRAVAPVQSIGSLVAERRGLAQQPAQVAQPAIEQPAPEVAPAEPVVSRAAAPVQGIGGLVAERRKLAENQGNPDAQISHVAGLSESVDTSASPENGAARANAAKTDTQPSMLYHITPKENRDSIAKSGLLTSRDATGMGATFFTDTKPASSDTFDVWSVPSDKLSDLDEDTTTEPSDGERWYANYSDVSPEHLKLERGVSNETADEGRQDDRQYAQGTESNADGDGQGRDEAALQTVQREGNAANETGVVPAKDEPPTYQKWDDAARHQEPPAQTGMVRVYRGEGMDGEVASDDTNKGRWFSTNREVAEHFLQNEYGDSPSRLSYVDLTPEQVQEFSDNEAIGEFASSNESAVIVPHEVANGSRTLFNYAPEVEEDNFDALLTAAKERLAPKVEAPAPVAPAEPDFALILSNLEKQTAVEKGKGNKGNWSVSDFQEYLKQSYPSVAGMPKVRILSALRTQAKGNTLSPVNQEVIDAFRHDEEALRQKYGTIEQVAQEIADEIDAEDYDSAADFFDAIIAKNEGRTDEARDTGKDNGEIEALFTGGSERDTQESQREAEATDDAGGWQQEVAVSAAKKVPTIGGVQKQGGKRQSTADLMDAFTPESPSLFSTNEKETREDLTLERVQSSFPSLPVTEDNGTFTVTTPSGIPIRISKVGEIEFGPEQRAAAEKEYGRKLRDDERPVAEFRPIDHGAIINLTEKGMGELPHEVFHLAMNLALTERQKAAVLRTFGNEEKAAAEYQRLKESGALETRKGNYWLAKIYRFLRSLRQLISPTAKGVMEDVASGKVWGKAHAGDGGARYAAQGQTDTPAFKRWFGGSKVVDKDGNPLVVYHGTPNPDFTKFNMPQDGDIYELGAGVYFTPNPDDAGRYAEIGGDDKRPAIVPVYLKVETPLELEYPAAWSEELAKELKNPKYDGVIARNENGEIVEIKVNSPSHIKSSIGNNGDFDPSNPDIRYSLRSAFTDHNLAALKSSLTVHPRVQALVGSVFNNGRNVSPWMRTVGTMYHMAEKLAAEGKPQFKAVFDKGQEFLTDVSTLALKAESLAPDIFPKMGTGKGLFHNLPRKDAIAIAEPLYQGTLFGGADPKKGKVFSDTELKRIFNLSDHQIELYKQARAATDQSLDDMAKSLIARNAKEAQVGFDREMDLADMAAEVKSAIQDKIDTMKTALDQLEDDFKNTPPDPDAKVQKKLDKAHNRAVSTQEAAIELHESFIKNVEDLAYKTDLLKRRGYFPLMRFGQYTVTMKDHSGKVEFFGLYESAYKARLMTDALQKDNPGMSVVQSVMGREKFKLFAGMNLEGLQLFAEHMKAEDSEAYQEYLKQAMNNRSAMKRLIHRKGTEGYSEDAVRTLANFITSNARHASTQYHLHDMRKLASEVPEDTQGDVQDQAVKLYEYLSKPVEEASKLRGYLFFHYLGGSLASGIVNMTQPVMMTMPYLASKTSPAKAAMHLTKAAKMSFTAPAKVGGELGVALRRAESEGVTAPQEIYQLTAMASNKLLAANPYWNAGLKAWGGFFSVAEAFNRRVTFIASFRISREKGLSPDRAYTEAVKAITETQGIYNKGNRPKWGRGTVGGTLFTFKQFSVMYLELFNRLPAKQKGIMLGILWLMAGLQGMPFAEDAEDIIDTIGQWAGFATNSKRWINQQAEDALGKDTGDFVTQGISSVLPLDLQGRMGLQNLIPGTGILKQSATDKGRDVKEFFGPAGGLLASLGDALTLAAQGLPGRSALAASPRAVQNIAQGVEMMATGAGHDKYGRKTVELSPGESAMKLTGFNPSRVAEEGQIKSANMQDVNLLRVRKNEISTQWAYGIAHKDSGEIAEAKRKLIEWNAKNPELKMNMGSVVQSARQKARALNTTGKERFLKSMPKEIRRRVIDELG